MYVFMYVCMYVCMYVFMYVCVYVCMCSRMEENTTNNSMARLVEHAMLLPARRKLEHVLAIGQQASLKCRHCLSSYCALGSLLQPRKLQQHVECCRFNAGLQASYEVTT